MSYTDLILSTGIVLGYALIFLTVFAESGLFIGFLLPGDSFLFTLGIIASQGRLNVGILLLLAFVGAVLGDSVGYATGYRLGPKLFNRKNSRFFKKENLERAQSFYDRHGNKTIVLARFTPIVRTFAPIVAGAAKMSYGSFLFYNIIGGAAWVFVMTILGYVLGSRIGNIDHYILPLIAVIVIASVIPPLLHLRPKKS